jgi:anti-sigma factor RsiW
MAVSEETEALMLAYVYGELPASAALEFERQMDADPELRAEVEGMKASHDLFGKDQAWGISAKVDVPPPHLMDAILKAELIARAPQVKEAMFKRDAPSSSSTSFTAKLSRWLLGGGLVVGAAAAVFHVVTRTSAANFDDDNIAPL